jgi:predicted metalloprotease with PDZ domain
VTLHRDEEDSLGVNISSDGLITSIAPGGPAALAGGVELRDRIVEVGGVPVPAGKPISSMLPKTHLPVVLTLQRGNSPAAAGVASHLAGRASKGSKSSKTLLPNGSRKAEKANLLTSPTSLRQSHELSLRDDDSPTTPRNRHFNADI